MFNPHTKFEVSTLYDYLQRRNERQRQMQKFSFWATLWGT